MKEESNGNLQLRVVKLSFNSVFSFEIREQLEEFYRTGKLSFLKGFRAQQIGVDGDDFDRATRFHVSKKLSGQNVRVLIDSFSFHVIGREFGTRDEMTGLVGSHNVEMCLSCYPKYEIANLSCHLRLENVCVDDVIFLSQCFDGKKGLEFAVDLPGVVKKEKLVRWKQDQDSWKDEKPQSTDRLVEERYEDRNTRATIKDVIKKYIKAIYGSCSIDCENKDKLKYFRSRIVEVVEPKGSGRLIHGNGHERQLYGLLTTDEGWRFVPKAWALEHAECVLGLRSTFQLQISFKNELIVDFSGKDEVFTEKEKDLEYDWMQNLLRDKYHQPREKYFTFVPRYGGLKHGQFLVLELVSIQYHLLERALFWDEDVAGDEKRLSDALKKRDRLERTMREVEKFKIPIIGVLYETIACGMGIPRMKEDLKEKKELHEKAIETNYNQRISTNVRMLTVGGIMMGFLHLVVRLKESIAGVECIDGKVLYSTLLWTLGSVVSMMTLWIVAGMLQWRLKRFSAWLRSRMGNVREKLISTERARDRRKIGSSYKYSYPIVFRLRNRV